VAVDLVQLDLVIRELEVLAWIGPADPAMIAAQHGVRSEAETLQRLKVASGLSLVRVGSDGRYALTDEGYTLLAGAIDGESQPRA
jgi:hypothetical protein